MGVKRLIDSIELSPTPCNGKESPIRAVFCLKKKADMRKFEQLEDCFILDFDPFESFDLSTISIPKVSDESDLSVLAENGKVACRDYPHPRHLCVKFPFEKTPHQTHCKMCYCFVCDTTAPCKEWTKGMKHCDAKEDGGQIWCLLRDRNKKTKLEFDLHKQF